MWTIFIVISLCAIFMCKDTFKFDKKVSYTYALAGGISLVIVVMDILKTTIG
jgi:hypothetical protein